jgi:hypothetical protein
VLIISPIPECKDHLLVFGINIYKPVLVLLRTRTGPDFG